MKIKEITKPIKYKLIVTDEEYEVIKGSLEQYMNNITVTDEHQEIAVKLHDSMLRGGIM